MALSLPESFKKPSEMTESELSELQETLTYLRLEFYADRIPEEELDKELECIGRELVENVVYDAEYYTIEDSISRKNRYGILLNKYEKEYLDNKKKEVKND